MTAIGLLCIYRVTESWPDTIDSKGLTETLKILDTCRYSGHTSIQQPNGAMINLIHWKERRLIGAHSEN